MTRLISSLLILLLMAVMVVRGNAQVTSEINPEAGDVTIEVDQSKSKNESKSLALSLTLSAILPGSGEYYLQEKSRAKIFFLTDTGFWTCLDLAWVTKDSYMQNARNYASAYAGIDASQKSESFLELMGAYRSYQEKQHRQDSY